jgi:hypothetical protein
MVQHMTPGACMTITEVADRRLFRVEARAFRPGKESLRFEGALALGIFEINRAAFEEVAVA